MRCQACGNSSGYDYICRNCEEKLNMVDEIIELYRRNIENGYHTSDEEIWENIKKIVNKHLNANK